MTEEMNKFIDEVDTLCFKYKFEIRPYNKRTILIVNEDGEEQLLLYIDGDGRGK